MARVLVSDGPKGAGQETGDLSTATIHARTEGRTQGFSEPAGATIIIDGSIVGVTPLKIINIDAGERAVTLRRDGCAAVDSSVRVTANATQTMSITLKPDGPLAGGETLPTILERAYRHDHAAGGGPFHQQPAVRHNTVP